MPKSKPSTLSPIDKAIDAYRAAGRHYQGFFYGNYLHVIRDVTKPWAEQKVWEREGSGADYDTAHEAMMEELERLQMRAAVQALREPSQSMCDAAMPWADEAGALDTWRAMIDEAMR